MTMNSTGPLSMGGSTVGESINLELGQAATATISLNDTNVRTLLQVPSGAISMNAAYGKSNRPTASTTFTTNTTSTSVNVASLSGYVAGSTDITITVNAGVYVYSTSTANYALTITGGTTGDTITVVNNGFIMGMGGAGSNYGAQLGSPGGPAIDISGIGTASITINNQNGYIGGGGGGGKARGNYGYIGYGGGGAGGGIGGANTTASPAPGVAGANGANLGTNNSASAGNGGRILPGTGGASVTAGTATQRPAGQGGGAGGGGSASYDPSLYVAYGGGGGGGWGAAGGLTGNSSTLVTSGAGGSAGNQGGDSTPGTFTQVRPAGGKAINTSTKTVTWVGGTASSSRAYGAVA